MTETEKHILATMLITCGLGFTATIAALAGVFAVALMVR